MSYQQKWKGKIDTETKKYETLEKLFYEIHKAELDTYKKRLEAFQEIDSLKTLESEDNRNLSDIYSQFNKTMKELEDKRMKHLNQLNSDLLPVTTYYYKDQLKTRKQELDNLTKTSKAKQNYENDSKKAQDKQDNAKVSELNKAFAESEQKEKRQIDDFRSAFCKFEAERTEDNKNLFLHYLLSELEYHSNALEKVSNLFQTINKIEPQENLKDFGDKMNIRINYRKINVDINELNRRKEQRDMEEKNQRDIKNQRVFGQ